MTRAIKQLGQNFLKDARALDRIVSILEISPLDTIIEIGPGHGELTRRILDQKPKRVVAIEKDVRMINEFLEPLLKENLSLEVVSGDALQILEENANKFGDYKLIGNIPYYITGRLLRLLGEIKNKPRIISLTLQKEVAERLCGEPPKMNLLAATVGFWGKPTLIRYISKKSFKPAPKVHSALVKIEPFGTFSDEESLKYYKLVKALFAHPRKTALNNLKPLQIDIGVLEKYQIESKARPQNLSIEKIRQLSSTLSSDTA